MQVFNNKASVRTQETKPLRCANTFQWSTYSIGQISFLIFLLPEDNYAVKILFSCSETVAQFCETIARIFSKVDKGVCENLLVLKCILLKEQYLIFYWKNGKIL